MGVEQILGSAPATTLAGAINNAVTTFSITSGTGWPTGSPGPFVVTVDRGLATEEKMLVTSRSGTSLTGITRAYDGSTAQAHLNLAVIEHTLSATMLAEANRIVNEQMGTSVYAASTTNAQTSKVTGEGNPRWVRDAAGKIQWGPGSGTVDVQLSRLAADQLELQDEFRVTRGAAANLALSNRVTADTQDRFEIQADGKILWGSGSIAADANLYRLSADKLKTDDALEVTGAFTALSTAAVTGLLTGSNLKSGTGSPEGVVTGAIGDVYQRTNGSLGTTLYVKESGAGNTGWRSHGGAAVSLLASSYADASTTTRSADQLVQSATVSAGLLTAGDTLRARFEYTFLNTGGSNETFVPKLRIGATTIFGSSTAVGTNSAGNQMHGGVVEFQIHLVSLTSLRCWGSVRDANLGAASPPAGIISPTAYGSTGFFAGEGFDTTVAENFANATAVGLVVNMSNNGTATSTFTVKNWTLERLPA